MGCGSSKRVDGSLDVYKPAAASLAVFDINAIEEPWLKQLNNIITAQEQDKEKAIRVPVPPPILHKLNMLEDDEDTEIPQSWDEVSKALHDLQPTLDDTAAASSVKAMETKRTPLPLPHKSLSFHTVEELDAKLTSNDKKQSLKKNESIRTNTQLKTSTNAIITNAKNESSPSTSVDEEFKLNFKPVKDNIFIKKDRLERSEKEKEGGKISKFDPLSEYQQKCPPGRAGTDGVVIYTTSLGGVRRTFDDCNRVRDVLEGHGVVFDERDVSLHGQYLNELKELLGEEGVAVPRVFLKGRYLGGIDHFLHLNETGRLRRILSAARVERGIVRQACGGCGGARFVPCLECGGSCKLLLSPAAGTGDNTQRCPECNENGLVKCPACQLSL